jgi:hypothetical protein
LKILLTIVSAVVALCVTGCKTSRVFERPLVEVRQAIQEVQPDLTHQFSLEFSRISAITNDVPGKSYSFQVYYPLNSWPDPPSLTVEADSLRAQRTRVTVKRTKAEGKRERDMERWFMEVLTVKLEKNP